MNIMATALQKAAAKGTAGKMISQAVAKVKREDKEARQREIEKARQWEAKEKEKRYNRAQTAWAQEYYRRITLAGRKGLGSLKPCSYSVWKPATPALAGGKPCRVKWGISDGVNNFVIVIFEYPQPLIGLNSKTTIYGFFPLNALTPCDCRGYIHKYGCAPERKSKQKRRGGSKKTPEPQKEKKK